MSIDSYVYAILDYMISPQIIAGVATHGIDRDIYVRKNY